MITTNAARLFTVKRQTAFVLDSTPTTVVAKSLDRQPARESLLQVRVFDGTNNTGTVTISGVSGGVAVSEVLTFSAAGYKQTTYRLTSVDAAGVAMAGFSGEATIPSIEIKSVGPDGSRQNELLNLVTGYPMHLDRGRGDWKGERSGSAQRESVLFLVDYTESWAPREGDVFVDDSTGEKFLAVSAPLLRGMLRIAHWEVRAIRHQM